MARKLLILFMSLLWCLPSVSIDFKIPYKTPDDCTPKQYFQFSSLRCQNCGTPGQIPSEDLLSCVCQTGYKVVEDKGGLNTLVCENCDTASSANTTSSLDGSFCVSCPNDVGFNTNTGTCNSCPDNYFATDRRRDGSRLKSRECVPCIEDTNTGLNYKQSCQRCHWSFLFNDTFCSSCSKDEGDYVISGGVCFTETRLIPDAASLYKVKYGDKEITSPFFQFHLRAAQAVCQENSNFTACQLLGNLCVMLEYTQTGNDACKQYTDLVNSKSSLGVVSDVNQDWPIVMPWLFYQNSANNAPEVLDKKDITQQFQSNEDMNFVFAVFTLNGSFVGYETSLDVLQICKDRPSKMASASKFATTYQSSCSVAVKELMKKPMLLYDMYLVLDKTLYPVPLLLENFKEGDEKVNEGTDREKWKLTRRFFVIDNLVGGDQWIRYPEKIEVNVRMRSTDGEIFPPMLRIRYKELDIKDEEILNGNQDASFAVTYEMDTAKIKKDTEVFVCFSPLES